MDYFDAFELGHKIGFGLIKMVLCVIVLIGLKIYFRFNFNTDRFQHVNHLLKCSSSETLKRAIFGSPLSHVFDFWSRSWSVAQLLNTKSLWRCHPRIAAVNSYPATVKHLQCSYGYRKKKSNSLISKFMVRFSLPLSFLQLHLQ